MTLSSRSSNSLELDQYGRRSADYAWQLVLAAGAMLVRLFIPNLIFGLRGNS